MVDVLDEIQGAPLGRRQVSGELHELERHLDTARTDGFPDLSAATPAQLLDQSVSGYGFRARPNGKANALPIGTRPEE